jgi:putative transposase
LTVLFDYSRYILGWKLCTIMTTAKVTETLRLALIAAALDQATVRQHPRLLSDNGFPYLSANPAPG